MNKLDVFLSKLPIDDKININETYKFNDYIMFVKVYNFLDNSTLVSKNSPQSYLTENDCHVEFDSDDFIVCINGNFEKDEYELIITEG